MKQDKPFSRSRLPTMVLGTCMLLSGLATAQGRLPDGFGEINVGDPWLIVKGRYEFEDKGSLNSEAERLTHDCGSMQLLAETDEGMLAVKVEDFVVIEISLLRNIGENADVAELSRHVIRHYGKPAGVTMRDVFGRPVEVPAQANYVSLHYLADNPMQVDVSGAPLWRIQERVRYKNQRLHQNKTQRCVRQNRPAPISVR